MIPARVGIEFSTQDGIVYWRKVYFCQITGEKVFGPWQQTAPELGFSLPVESNDRQALERLYRALRAKVVGETLVEAGPFHIAERLNLRPSAL